MIPNLLIIGLFFFFITGEVLRFNLGHSIYFKPLDAIVIFSATIFWLFYFLKKIKLPSTKVARPLVIFSFIALFSLIVNSRALDQGELLSASLYWLRFISYASVYFWMLSIDKKYIKRVLQLAFMSGVLILLLGLIQYFLYPNLQNLYYLGWDEHTHRLFSVFLDPNFAGAFLCLFLFFLLSGVVYFKGNNDAKRAGLMIALSLLAAASVFLTYSRSAILMLVAGLVVYLVLIKRKELIAVLIGFVLLAIIISIPGVNRESTNLFRTTSFFARLNSYENAFIIIKDKPVFGVGFNAYRSAQQERGFFDNLDRYPKNSGAGVDSSLLFVAATTGIIGLCAYIYLWYVTIKRSLYLYKKRVSASSLLVLCSAAGLFINSLFINSLFYPSVMLWMWVMIGLMEREAATPR